MTSSDIRLDEIAALKQENVRLTEENEALKQEVARLRKVKRPMGQPMDSMSTKLKEALRE